MFQNKVPKTLVSTWSVLKPALLQKCIYLLYCRVILVAVCFVGACVLCSRCLQNTPELYTFDQPHVCGWTLVQAMAKAQEQEFLTSSNEITQGMHEVLKL